MEENFLQFFFLIVTEIHAVFYEESHCVRKTSIEQHKWRLNDDNVGWDYSAHQKAEKCKIYKLDECS